MDRPLEEIQLAAEDILRHGGAFYQKWTCAKCGERVTMSTPNALFTEGHHEDCGHITDLRNGCGLMAVLSRGVS